MEAKKIQFKTILVPTDFSEYSKPSLDYATHLASQNDAKLYCLHVLSHYPGYGLLYDSKDIKNFEEGIKEKANKALAEFVSPEEYGHLTIKALVRTGKPSHEIVEAAKEIKADLIVISTHGSGFAFLQKAVFGSTAQNLLLQSPVPVLSIPASKDADA